MDPFVEVYIASNVPDAYIIKAALEGAGITAQITNEFLDGAMGGVPLGAVTPRILVPQSQADAAREILQEMASQPDNENEWEEDLGDDQPEQ